MKKPWRWREESLPFTVYLLAREDEPRAAGLVTTRRGGLSKGPFEGLNLSLRVGDEPAHVEGNKALIAGRLGLDPERRASPEQVHGSLVLVANSPGLHRRADGLATSSGEIWLSVYVADCVPVLLFAPDLSAVGLAHAGRKGTAAGITTQLIRRFGASFGVNASELVLALGPSIGPCCYELDAATAATLPNECLSERDGRLYFDLWKANSLQALGAGILEHNLVQPPACTSCRSEVFFSHRAHRGRTGRQAAITRAGGLWAKAL